MLVSLIDLWYSFYMANTPYAQRGAKMKKEQWINIAMMLVAQSKSSLTGWERDFSEAEIKALREEWNKNAHDTDYWRE